MEWDVEEEADGIGETDKGTDEEELTKLVSIWDDYDIESLIVGELREWIEQEGDGGESDRIDCRWGKNGSGFEI